MTSFMYYLIHKFYTSNTNLQMYYKNMCALTEKYIILVNTPD